MKKLKKIDKNYLLIIVFGLLALYLVVPENYIFGSNTDWVSQHIVFPDYFRKHQLVLKRHFRQIISSYGEICTLPQQERCMTKSAKSTVVK